MLKSVKKLPIFGLNIINFLFILADRLKQTNAKINKAKKIRLIIISLIFIN